MSYERGSQRRQGREYGNSEGQTVCFRDSLIRLHSISNRLSNEVPQVTGNAVPHVTSNVSLRSDFAFLCRLSVPGPTPDASTVAERSTFSAAFDPSSELDCVRRQLDFRSPLSVADGRFPEDSRAVKRDDDIACEVMKEENEDQRREFIHEQQHQQQVDFCRPWEVRACNFDVLYMNDLADHASL